MNAGDKRAEPDKTATPPHKLDTKRGQWVKGSTFSSTAIIATGKQSRAVAINERVQRLNGLTFDQAMKLPIPGRKGPNGTDGLYRLSDYNYDLKHGYIQHAAYATQPTYEEACAAWEETKFYYQQACLTTTGGEPQSRKQAIESGNWLGPDGWYATELAEMEALERMGVLRWCPLECF